MSIQGRTNRRQFLRFAVSCLGLASLAPIVTACQPKVVEKVVKETVVVEKAGREGR